MRAVGLCSAATMFFAAPLPAYASDWGVLVEQTGLRLVVDVQSVSEADGLRRAWFKSYYPLRKKSLAVRSLTLEAFDCGARKSVTERSITYDKGGNVLSSDSRPSSVISEFAEFVAPDTIGETMLDFVCKFPIGSSATDVGLNRQIWTKEDGAPSPF